MKPLAEQGTNLGTYPAQIDAEKATVVRLYNSSSSNETVTFYEYDPMFCGHDIGSLTIPAGEVIYAQKKAEDFMTSTSNSVYYTKVAYSHMMSYTSYTSSGGGGGGGLINTNLVLHLDAGDSSSYSGSGTTWTDLTGNGNDGTLINGVSYSSSNGGYLNFDGTNDRVDFSSYVQPAHTSSSSFTWFVWLYPFETLNNDVIMGNRAVTGSNVWTKLTPKRFEWVYPNHMNESGSGTNVTTNHWQNICITKNGASFTYYKNGTSVATMTSTHSKNYTNPFHIGGDASYGENVQARISVVAVYDAALTASEVLQNYNVHKSRYGL